MKNKLISVLLILTMLSSISAFALTAEEKDILKDETDIIEKVEETTVKIMESDVIRDVDNNMLGLDWEFQEFSDVNILGGGTEMTKEYKDTVAKLKDTFSLARVMGAPSSYYFYSDNVGPIDQRKSRNLNKYLWDVGSPGYGGHPKSRRANFGPAEWIKAAYEMNPKTRFIVTINIFTADVEETRRSVSFFRGKPGELVIDGVDYAQLRVDSGIPEPVEVAMYEMGNEVCWAEFANANPDDYVRVIREHMAVIRELDPDAKFAYCGAMIQSWATGPEGMDWRYWTFEVYPQIVDEIDYVTHHPYHSGTGLATFDKYLDQLTADHIEAGGKVCPHVYTEYADWPEFVNGETGYSFSQEPIALDGALSNAMFLNRMYMRTDVWGATYFLNTEYDNGCWGIYTKRNGKLRIHGPGYMFNIYADVIEGGGKVVNHEVEGSYLADPEDDRCRFGVLAIKQGKDTLKLIIVNRSPYVQHNVKFEFENNYTLTEEVHFTAPNINSFVVSDATENIFTTTTTEKNEPNFNYYEMPNKSMVVLTLKSDKPYADMMAEIAAEEGAGDDEVLAETGFADMDGHWASGIVAKYAETGVVNGDENGKFNPDSDITRAELAKILALASGEEIPENPQKLFSDVSADSWYAPYVQAAYGAGLMRGKSGGIFAPDEKVTLEELAAVAARKADKDITVSENEKENILRGFIYRDRISSWAENDLLTAIKSGAMNRLYENGYFDAKANATRAQTVSVINRIYG